MSNEINYTLLHELEDYLLGTCKGESEAIEAFSESSGMDSDMFYFYIGSSDIECCAGCGWWYNNNELQDIDGDLICEDCK